MQVNRATNVATQRTYQVACQPGVPAAEAIAPQGGRAPGPLVVTAPPQSQRDQDNMGRGVVAWAGMALAAALPVAWPAGAMMAAAGAVGWLIELFQPKKPLEPALPVPVSVTNPNEPKGGTAAARATAVPEPAKPACLRDRIFDLMTEVWGTDAYCNDTSYRWWVGQLKLAGGDFERLRQVMTDYAKSIERP
ncbi:MAG: hypothetical protein ACK46X_06160 [Candidatus Sericytochromatia bacterium]